MARPAGSKNKPEPEETKVESKTNKLILGEGEKIKQAKGDTPHYDRTEAPPGIMVGKGPKFI